MKIKFVLAFGLLTLLSPMVFAQGGALDKANEAYASERYNEGAKLCEEAYNKISRKKGQRSLLRKGRMAFMTAECYRHTERYREANDWYHKCVLLEYENTQPEVMLYKGDMLLMMREYEEAKEAYTKYKELAPSDERGQAGIDACNKNETFQANKGREIIENEVRINKPELDMAPMFGDRKMSAMYFSSSRDGCTGKGKDPRSGEAYTDIWVVQFDKKGQPTEPKLIEGEGINTDQNEGAVCFDERKKKMFFTRCPNEKKKNLGCDIWVSDTKGKTAWGEPTKLELKTNDTISVGHPCTKDGKFLIFASDMPGGFGGRDLWYSQYDRKSDSWSAPKNMGPEINTAGDELFPSFALNGDLFFATNGRPGLGGLDIFRATPVEGEENKWEKPANIGAPVNGEHNDYAIIEKDPRHGYFTSERKGPNGEGGGDIYSYEIPPFLYSLKVIVADEVEKDRLEGVEVNVTGSDGTSWAGITDENGGVFWDKKPTGDRYINEEESYKINIKSIEGYYENKVPSEITTIEVAYNQDFVIEMGLFPKRPIRLPEVRYPLNKWSFVVDSTINSPDSLLYVYNLLKDRPELVLELSSHTDSRGGAKRNQTLSENRARACYKYLVEEKGIDPRRIIPVGKGENEPRKVWLMDGTYHAKQPKGDEFEEIVLTEAYINKFSRDRKTFEMLHAMNRRTEGAVYSLEFDPETAEDADPKYKEYLPYR